MMRRRRLWRWWKRGIARRLAAYDPATGRRR